MYGGDGYRVCSIVYIVLNAYGRKKIQLRGTTIQGGW